MENPIIDDFCKKVNPYGESLTKLLQKAELDNQFNGNDYIEVVTNRKRSFINLYHHDFTDCRLSEKLTSIKIANWKESVLKDAEIDEVALFKTGDFTETADGNLRCIIHFKDYEPEYKHYGVMSWIGGMNPSALIYKTGNWNLSRVDNSFQSSGAFLLHGDLPGDMDFEEVQEAITDAHVGEGNQGNMLFLQVQGDNNHSKYVPFGEKFEGDWSALTKEARQELIASHEWYVSLSGFAQNTGFETNRLEQEYHMALTGSIRPRQIDRLSVIKQVLNRVMGWDADTLQYINETPYRRKKPKYMMVWEARKMDGIDYDKNDPKQQTLLGDL